MDELMWLILFLIIGAVGSLVALFRTLEDDMLKITRFGVALGIALGLRRLGDERRMAEVQPASSA